MKRLTIDEILRSQKFELGEDFKNANLNALAKSELLEYKYIERELGIDLITLFKALKNGVYTINGFEYPTLIIDYSKHNPLGFNFLLKGKIVLFKDYGKTWWLTKKELKNEKTDKEAR